MPDFHSTLMPLLDWWNAFSLILLRWIHIVAGIIWIGHLYFFNFVQGPFEKTMDAATKKAVVPQLRPRALFWFRWGAMITFLSGIFYFVYAYFIQTDEGFAYFKGDKGQWIGFGMLLATIMWFNVWFVIWPRQKKIITGIATGNKPADFDALVAVAGKASRVNTYLSLPMVFGMVMGAHTPVTLGGKVNGIAMLIVLVVGVAIAYHLVNQVAGKVGTEFAPPAPPPPPPPPAAPPK